KDNLLIGSCGYKGEPDQNGTVEIGYEIKNTYRNRGYGKEVAQLLTQHVLDSGLVTRVIAHTLPFEYQLTSVLIWVGYQMDNEVQDESDGLVWKCEFIKPQQ